MPIRFPFIACPGRFAAAGKGRGKKAALSRSKAAGRNHIFNPYWVLSYHIVSKLTRLRGAFPGNQGIKNYAPGEQTEAGT